MNRKLIMPLTTIAMILIITVLAKFEIINNYFQTIIVTICINAIMSASLNIVNGYMGEFSCGHGGFMATGAYVSAVASLILFKDGNSITGSALLPESLAVIGFPICILLGGLGAMLVSLIVAIPSFKTRDDYLAIITVAANFIVTTAINNIPLVGGSRGLMGMKSVMNSMGDVFDVPWILIWALVFAVFAIVSIHFLMNSTLGKGISAVKYDEISAEIMSVNTNNMKLIAFTFIYVQFLLGRNRGRLVRALAWLYQSGKFWNHEVNRVFGNGLPWRHGLAERLGSFGGCVYDFAGTFAPRPNFEVGNHSVNLDFDYGIPS